MTPNPLPGAIDETQPHQATEAGMSEKPTMREVLKVIADWDTVSLSGKWDFELRDIIRAITDRARAALATLERPDIAAALATAKSLRANANEPFMTIGGRAFASDAAHVIETLCAVLAAEEESGWRTMDSAPKDADVLVWRGNRRLGARPQGVVRACWWQPTRYEGKWVTVPGLHGIKPTHWRPLPSPPSSKDEP